MDIIEMTKRDRRLDVNYKIDRFIKRHYRAMTVLAIIFAPILMLIKAKHRLYSVLLMFGFIGIKGIYV